MKRCASKLTSFESIQCSRPKWPVSTCSVSTSFSSLQFAKRENPETSCLTSMSQTCVSCQIRKKTNSKKKFKPSQKRLLVSKSSSNMLASRKEAKKKSSKCLMTQSKTLKGRNTMARLKICTHCHQLVNSSKIFCQRSHPMISTLRLKQKPQRKAKTKHTLTKSKRKKVLKKTGSKCVLKGGTGWDKRYHTTLHLMPNKFPPKHQNSAPRKFPSLRIDWKRLSKSSIWTAKLIIRSLQSHSHKQHGRNFSWD